MQMVAATNLPALARSVERLGMANCRRSSSEMPLFFASIGVVTILKSAKRFALHDSRLHATVQRIFLLQLTLQSSRNSLVRNIYYG